MSLRIRIGGGPVPISVTNPAAIPAASSGAGLLAGDLRRTTVRERSQIAAAPYLAPFQVGPLEVPQLLVDNTARQTLGPVRAPVAGFRVPYFIPRPPNAATSGGAAPAPTGSSDKPCQGC